MAGSTMFLFVLLAVPATAVLRGAWSHAMQPKVVSHLLSEVEHKWKAAALASLKGEISNATALAEVEQSCQKVSRSIIDGASGNKDRVIEYMKEVCQASSSADMCREYASQIESFMTYDEFQNREQLDLNAFCAQFYKAAVMDKAHALKTAAEKSAIEAAAATELKEKAESEKKKAEAISQRHAHVEEVATEVKDAAVVVAEADAKDKQLSQSETEAKKLIARAEKEIQTADEREVQLAEEQAKQAADEAQHKRKLVEERQAREHEELANAKKVDVKVNATKVEEKHNAPVKTEKAAVQPATNTTKTK